MQCVRSAGSSLWGRAVCQIGRGQFIIAYRCTGKEQVTSYSLTSYWRSLNVSDRTRRGQSTKSYSVSDQLGSVYEIVQCVRSVGGSLRNSTVCRISRSQTTKSYSVSDQSESVYKSVQCVRSVGVSLWSRTVCQTSRSQSTKSYSVCLISNSGLCQIRRSLAAKSYSVSDKPESVYEIVQCVRSVSLQNRPLCPVSRSHSTQSYSVSGQPESVYKTLQCLSDRSESVCEIVQCVRSDGVSLRNLTVCRVSRIQSTKSFSVPGQSEPVYKSVQCVRSVGVSLRNRTVSVRSVGVSLRNRTVCKIGRSQSTKSYSVSDQPESVYENVQCVRVSFLILAAQRPRRPRSRGCVH